MILRIGGAALRYRARCGGSRSNVSWREGDLPNEYEDTAAQWKTAYSSVGTKKLTNDEIVIVLVLIVEMLSALSFICTVLVVN